MRLHGTRLAAISYGRGLGDALWDLAGAPPLLDQRLAQDRSLIDAVSGQQLIIFTRASDGTFVGSNGLIQTAGTNVPRFDHNPLTGECLGLLVEEQRTNSIRNNTMVGAVAGTPGTLPTNWLQQAIDAGLTSQVVGSGSLNGINYVDIRISGTASSTTGWSMAFDQTTAIPATSGQSWTGSIYLALAGGSLSGTSSPTLRVIERSTAGSYVTETGLNWSSVGQALNASSRFSITRPSMGTTTGYVQLGIYFFSVASAAIDITLRIGLPQLEQGAFATSVIPTSTTAVTRSASVVDVINQAIANNIRTLYLEFRSPASGTRGVVSLNDNTANERVNMLTSGTDPRLVIVDGGVEQANINGGTITANTRTRVAVRINENDFAISINGAAVVTDTSGTLPTVDRLMLGRTQAGEHLNGTLARVTGWREALPNSTLQSLAS